MQTQTHIKVTLLTVGEAAKFLRVHTRTVLRYLAAGKLGGFRLPHEKPRHGEWRIPSTELDKLAGTRSRVE